MVRSPVECKLRSQGLREDPSSFLQSRPSPPDPRSSRVEGLVNRVTTGLTSLRVGPSVTPHVPDSQIDVIILVDFQSNEKFNIGTRTFRFVTSTMLWGGTFF